MRQSGAKSDQSEQQIVEVGIAEYAVTDDGAQLSTYGLGSCVAIALFDDDAGVSGLAHVMLPSAKRGKGSEPGKFADTAIAVMLEEMKELGANPANVEAKLVGGSEMFDFTGIAEGVGKRNVESSRRELRSLGISIEAEDVGGSHGRSVRFDGRSGVIHLKTADQETTTL